MDRKITKVSLTCSIIFCGDHLSHPFRSYHWHAHFCLYHFVCTVAFCSYHSVCTVATILSVPLTCPFLSHTHTHIHTHTHTHTACDYAHESTGFLTWHRILLLWLERELQILSGNYAFRISYWDWTNEEARAKQLDLLFSYDRLGSSSQASPNVSSKYFGSWKTICLEKCNDKCDPDVTGLPLKRCLNDNYCNSTFPEWPSREDLEEAWNMDSFEDPQKHNKYAENSFGNFVEGYESQDGSCEKTTCNCDWRGGMRFARKLHNTVSEEWHYHVRCHNC